jgi:hypothetical protein
MTFTRRDALSGYVIGREAEKSRRHKTEHMIHTDVQVGRGTSLMKL